MPWGRGHGHAPAGTGRGAPLSAPPAPGLRLLRALGAACLHPRPQAGLQALAAAAALVYGPIPPPAAASRCLSLGRRRAKPGRAPPPWPALVLPLTEQYCGAGGSAAPSPARARGRVLAPRAGASRPGSLVLYFPPFLCLSGGGGQAVSGARGGRAEGSRGLRVPQELPLPAEGVPAHPGHLCALDTSRRGRRPRPGVPALHNPLYTFLLRSPRPSTTSRAPAPASRALCTYAFPTTVSGAPRFAALSFNL